jgi:catalase
MALPSDEKIVQLANSLLAQLGAIFGLHPGFRPARATGLMLSGTFTPSPEAISLTRAPHLTRASTPVSARFSNGIGRALDSRRLSRRESPRTRDPIPSR